ncbi:MAG TPA: glycosyltransferase [Bacteroidia bacterium]
MGLLFGALIYIGAILCVCYLILITAYCIGWIGTESTVLSDEQSVSISIIIASRNEEKNISLCLNAILQQSYSKAKYELIVIDDHSSDGTVAEVEVFCAEHTNIKLLRLPQGKAGKKQAISAGIDAAKGELIVTTDADCVMGKDWLACIVSLYLKGGVKMIVGPVAFEGEKTLFEKMQSLEFMALIGCGGASLFYKKAIMCNGANLAYSKAAYEEVNGFYGIEEKASGDDVLLMYKINEKYPGAVRFLKNREAIVCTRAKQQLKDFIQQRKRWSSKGFWAFNTETKITALIVYLFSLYLVLVPLIDLLCYRNSFFHQVLTDFCLILLGIKCFIDFLLLFLTASFFKKERFLLLFLPEQILYLMYVVLIGIIGSIGKFEWKDRIIN